MDTTPDPADRPPRPEAGDGASTRRPGPSVPVVVGGVLVYGALGLALAAIGGWVGMVAVLALAALVTAGVVVAGSW